MSKSFLKPIANHQLGRLTPMSIELDKSVSGLGKYAKLADNAIYYYNSLQYRGGSLYRVALGYEIFWDRKKETELMLCLDYLLTNHADKNEYYFEELTPRFDARTHGEEWLRGVAPKTLTFALQRGYDLRAGETLTARVNTLDKPYHVDIERSNGDVFSIPHARYEHFRTKLCKVKGDRYESKSRRRTASTPSREGSSLSLVRELVKENPTRPLFKTMLALRQGC